MNYADVKQLAADDQIKLADTKEAFCEPCTIDKQHAISNHQPQTRATAMFDLIYVDLGGGQGTLPGATSFTSYDEELPPTPRDAKRFIILTDDYTRYR